MGLLDANHVIIQLSIEEDYTRIFIRRIWFINKSPMTVSKWTLDFTANHEMPIALLWVNFSGLPLPLFNNKYY